VAAAVLIRAVAVVQADQAEAESIHQAHRWKIPYSLGAEEALVDIAVMAALAVMHPMVRVLTVLAVVAAVAVLGPMQALHLPTATDHLLEEVLDCME
jgi:hypothetical protein